MIRIAAPLPREFHSFPSCRLDGAELQVVRETRGLMGQHELSVRIVRGTEVRLRRDTAIGAILAMAEALDVGVEIKPLGMMCRGGSRR